jgi:hypothetical protein
MPVTEKGKEKTEAAAHPSLSCRQITEPERKKRIDLGFRV